MQNQKRSRIPIPDDKENPSIKKPARDRKPPPSRASREPLSPTQPPVASEQPNHVSAGLHVQRSFLLLWAPSRALKADCTDTVTG